MAKEETKEKTKVVTAVLQGPNRPALQTSIGLLTTALRLTMWRESWLLENDIWQVTLNNNYS